MNGIVKTVGSEFNLGQFDAIYIPRNPAIDRPYTRVYRRVNYVHAHVLVVHGGWLAG